VTKRRSKRSAAWLPEVLRKACQCNIKRPKCLEMRAPLGSIGCDAQPATSIGRKGDR
jgi:hypothetical protein